DLPVRRHYGRLPYILIPTRAMLMALDSPALAGTSGGAPSPYCVGPVPLSSPYSDRDLQKALQIGAMLNNSRRTSFRHETAKSRYFRGFPDTTGFEKGGRYWARTSDLRLVEAALSQLS